MSELGGHIGCDVMGSPGEGLTTPIPRVYSGWPMQTGSLRRDEHLPRSAAHSRRPSRRSRDRATGPRRPGRTRASLVSRNSAGNPANGDSSDEGGGSAISGDGRVVVFFSKAANLPGGDGVGYQVYARDTRSRRTRLASTKANGDPADGFVFGAAISANGRFVTFYGPGNGLPGADGLHDRVWRHDLRTGATVLVSKANSGAPASGGSSYSLGLGHRPLRRLPVQLGQPPRRRWHQTLRLPARYAPPQDDPAQQNP